MMRYCLLLLLSHLFCVLGASIVLNKDNFDQVTEGKTVFIKFYATWCSHCQQLAPEWERMAQEWNNHPIGLVGEVDCSDKMNEAWCSDEIEILGLPTIKFGDSSFGGIFLEQFNGERQYAALSKFANETLSKPSCSPGNLNGCTPTVRAQLESFWKLDDKAIEVEINKGQEKIELAEKEFKEAFDEMQAIYDKQSLEHEVKSARIRETIKMLKATKELKLA